MHILLYNGNNTIFAGRARARVFFGILMRLSLTRDIYQLCIYTYIERCKRFVCQQQPEGRHGGGGEGDQTRGVSQVLIAYIQRVHSMKWPKNLWTKCTRHTIVVALLLQLNYCIYAIVWFFFVKLHCAQNATVSQSLGVAESTPLG